MNYIEVLAKNFSHVSAHCIGDPDVYANIVYESGDPLPTQEEVDAAKFTDEQDNTWLSIKQKRDDTKAGGVLVSSYWFHSDDTSRIQQIGLVLLGSNIPSGLQWKTMSGDFVTMTPTLAHTIFQTIAVSDTQIFSVAENHRQAMLASSDPENYDFSANWPTVYADVVASQEA